VSQQSGAGVPIRFLLAMPWGRVGSHLLVGILSRSLGHARLRMASEELTVRPDWTSDDQLAWLDDHFGLGRRTDGLGMVTHIGSKESAVAVRDRDRFSARCVEGGIRIVRMRRANVVKAAVSQVRARDHAATSGGWSIAPDEPAPGPSFIEPMRLRGVIDTMVAADAMLRSMFTGCAVHDVEYADLLRDLDGVVHRVRDFLTIEQRAYQVTHAKMTPDDLTASVLNLDEIALSLRGTPYEQLLLE